MAGRGVIEVQSGVQGVRPCCVAGATTTHTITQCHTPPLSPSPLHLPTTHFLINHECNSPLPSHECKTPLQRFCCCYCSWLRLHFFSTVIMNANPSLFPSLPLSPPPPRQASTPTCLTPTCQCSSRCSTPAWRRACGCSLSGWRRPAWSRRARRRTRPCTRPGEGVGTSGLNVRVWV